MSLAGIAKLNGLYSCAEQKGLSLVEGLEALKYQRVGSNRLATTRSLICGGLTGTALHILSSSRQQGMVVKLQYQLMRLQQSSVSLIVFLILILYGWVMSLRSPINRMRKGV